ncbi:MAG: flagellar export protein FliJ [bacterium]|nr:flagellar export protein FliJ [bacterium]
MKKFKFRLERVVDVRKTKEKECQRELAVSQAEYQRQLRRLEEAAEDSAHSSEKLRQALTKSATAGDLKLMHGWRMWQAEELRAQAYRTEAQECEVEEKREALIQASKDKKILEKLKERRQEEYRIEAEKETQAFLDELGCRIGRSWRPEVQCAELEEI